MKTPSRVFVLGALVNLAACNSTTIAAEANANGSSDSESDLKYRLDNGIGSFHGLGGVNYDLVRNVLSQLRTGASDVLVAVPTQVGRIDLFNNNAVVPRYQFGRRPPPSPPHLVPFPPGAPYKGGGYRGVKSLPLTPVGGGYRGVPPPAVSPFPAVPPLGAQIPENPSAVERPFRPILPQGVHPSDREPSRDGRFDKDSNWTPEVVVDESEVIREDEAFRPVPRPDRPRPEAVFKPDTDVTPSDGSRPPRESHRPPVVPVTDDGPPSKDFISQLEADLVAGLTPQQLEELSFQAIDPRTVESKTSKKFSGRIIFPGRVV